MTDTPSLYHISGLPILQNCVFNNREEATSCKTADVRLSQNINTGIVHNVNFDPSLITYDKNYQNEQAFSPRFKSHLQEVANLLQQQFMDMAILEIGCGKGFFLEYLSNLNFKIKGIDPSYEGTNPNITKNHFTPELNLRGQAIVLRHVLEHIDEPIKFLHNILEANNRHGKIYIEVPCLDWICTNQAWFDIFYEHVNYFRLSDFETMFSKIYDMGHLFNGQYIYIIADLSSINRPPFKDIVQVNFPAEIFPQINKLQSLYGKNSDHKRRQKIIWGASSKGVIFSILMQRNDITLDFAVDINPAKQQKFLPVSGLAINSPEESQKLINKDAVIFVMNSNYLAEVKNTTNNQFNYVVIDNDKL
jgi:SAM-dependent methyltransferase